MRDVRVYGIVYFLRELMYLDREWNERLIYKDTVQQEREQEYSYRNNRDDHVSHVVDELDIKIPSEYEVSQVRGDEDCNSNIDYGKLSVNLCSWI